MHVLQRKGDPLLQGQRARVSRVVSNVLILIQPFVEELDFDEADVFPIRRVGESEAAASRVSGKSRAAMSARRLAISIASRSDGFRRRSVCESMSE
jgi:hypothetical protein